MAIFSSLLQVIFPLLHESNTKYSHFSVFPHRWQSLVCVARFCGNYGQHQLSHRYFPAYNKSLAFATAALLVRCARILRTRANVNIYTSFSGFAHSFSFNPVPVQSRMSEKLGAAKSYVIDCWTHHSSSYLPLICSATTASTNCARNTYHTRGIVRKLVFD